MRLKNSEISTFTSSAQIVEELFQMAKNSETALSAKKTIAKDAGLLNKKM